MASHPRKQSLFDSAIVRRALVDAVRKLSPRHQVRNPVMFTVYVGSLLTTGLFVQSLGQNTGEPPWFILSVTLWLWFTVLFANFAEAMAEGRGKAQADTLRRGSHHGCCQASLPPTAVHRGRAILPRDVRCDRGRPSLGIAGRRGGAR